MIVKLLYLPADHQPVIVVYDVPERVLLDITFQLAEYEKAGPHETEPRQDASEPRTQHTGPSNTLF